MFYLIETKDQMSKLHLKKAFVDVITWNDYIHPALNKVSLVYLKDIESEKSYIISSKHNDSLYLPLGEIKEFLNSIESLYVADKKSFLYYFPIKKVIEIEFNRRKYEDVIYNHYYRLYKSRLDVNQIIPLAKHFERMNELYRQIEIPDGESFYSKRASIAFLSIEKNGIKFDPNLFESYFEVQNPNFSISEGKIYTQYNLNTLTKRPSNSFNGINFSALNKTNKCRKAFIPENDYLVDIDISAYHPSLIAEVIGYDFKGQDIHKHFAELYNVDYAKSKEITFQQLYGNIFKQYKDLEFFKLTQEYIDKTWDEFKKKGLIKTISGHIIRDQDQMTPNKLFNYIIQELETYKNVEIIWDMIRLLNGKNSKLVLYVYDSFCIDWDKNETGLLKDIEDIFTRKGLKVKIKKGTTYNF